MTRRGVVFGACLSLALIAERGAAQTSPIPPPTPRHEVRLERSVMIPMQDGVKLSTDLFWPVGAQGKLPVVLTRTPYNKNPYHGRADGFPLIFAGEGYVVAV